MAQSRDLRHQIDHLVQRAEHEVLGASRQLADGIQRESERFVPPFSGDIERLVDEVFDFAERVLKGQRKMVCDMVKTVNEQSRRTAEHTRRVRATASRKPIPARVTTPKRAPTKKAPAKKIPASKHSSAKV